MKTLDSLVANLRKLLIEKRNRLSESEDFCTDFNSELNNRELEIDNFEALTKKAETSPLYRKEVWRNFSKGANDIAEAIEKIGQVKREAKK